MKTPRFLQRPLTDAAGIRAELVAGLTAPHAWTSPKYLYDALGSRLFEAITELPEYDTTRTEAGIVTTHRAAMAAAVPRDAVFIDLGAGNCNKAASLFAAFQPACYLAVDISVDFLRAALECLQRQHPALDMIGLGIDFSAGLQLPAELELPAGPRVLFYPGSSIGNFNPDEAHAFLKTVHTACRTEAGSGLLIGVDLIKDPAELEAAYDDALGVTAAFNRNLLLHINRLAGTDFRLADWRHLSRFDATEQRVEMHLEALRTVTVSWTGGARTFAAGDRIHTENAYKWTVPRFAALLAQAGFRPGTVWTDPRDRFALFWAPA